MHYLPALVFLGAVSATALMETGQRQALMALKGVMERQTQFCKPVPLPATCEASCGPGYVTCISFPTCYNPGAGETCCSNGDYCPAGYYCTDAGCCPTGTPLSQCGATVSLSVIPPPASTATGLPPPVSTVTGLPPTPSETTSSVTTVETSALTTSSPPPTITSTSSNTTTTSRIPVVTAGAAQLGTNALAGLAGLYAALMAL